MKYILILGLAFGSISTTAFAAKPETPGPVGADDGTGAGVNLGGGRKGPK
jgi:hypothetical protein